MTKPKLIVHGGAWNIPKEYHEAHIKGCYAVIEKVYPQLENGISALDAVEHAVNLLEEDPTFDAGRGAFLNAEGEIELDAIICDGFSLAFGAVAAIKNILHPVSAARLLINYPEHCFMVGEGAKRFLRTLKFPEVAVEELLTARELEFYRQIKTDPNFHTRKPFEPYPGDTVGAVALDKKGNLAAATSTGGTPRKLPGRVGDSPVIGAGAYADNHTGAVSATGFGESIMKVVLSKLVCDNFVQFNTAQATQKGIEALQRVEGLGGIIGIDYRGNYGFNHNTRYMAFAYFRAGKEIIAGIQVTESNLEGL
jgi:beta-aspartyl-peptidase (threonine type)